MSFLKMYACFVRTRALAATADADAAAEAALGAMRATCAGVSVHAALKVHASFIYAFALVHLQLPRI